MNTQSMRVGERRLLTDAEQEIGRSVFADEIDWPSIQMLQAPPLGFGAMAPFRRTIIFSHWRASRDFSAADIDRQGWFVHELAHVWQAGCGVLLPIAKLSALGKSAYRYKPVARAELASFNIERQAEIARHLFLARSGAPAPSAPQLPWLEAVWATRASVRRDPLRRV